MIRTTWTHNPVVPALAALLVATFLSAPPAFCADALAIPPIENLERLASWRAGVAAADARERPLQIVCIGDSNTESPAYVGELRRTLQGCYGERGIGYHSLGSRNPVPESPKIERQGKWELLRDAPKPSAPPPPYFALDGIWAQSADPQAEVAVEKQFTSDKSKNNQVIEWVSPDTFPYSITPMQPFGYEVKALIPLSQLVLKPDSREFLLEAAVVAAMSPGSPAAYIRMFATHADAGAFRDARQSARVEVTR